MVDSIISIAAKKPRNSMLKMAQASSSCKRLGIEVAFITGLTSNIVQGRASDLGVEELVQGCFDKDIAAAELIKRKGLEWQETAFIGDDLIDLNLLNQVGFAFAVNDAVEAVRLAADYVTNLKGGHGAVREIVRPDY
jgi:YrbI family 3-deoxy-D-manno-octulosonate 8-phosphate phosphatase